MWKKTQHCQKKEALLFSSYLPPFPTKLSGSVPCVSGHIYEMTNGKTWLRSATEITNVQYQLTNNSDMSCGCCGNKVQILKHWLPFAYVQPSSAESQGAQVGPENLWQWLNISANHLCRRVRVLNIGSELGAWLRFIILGGGLFLQTLTWLQYKFLDGNSRALNTESLWCHTR